MRGVGLLIDLLAVFAVLLIGRRYCCCGGLVVIGGGSRERGEVGGSRMLLLEGGLRVMRLWRSVEERRRRAWVGWW